MNNLYHQIDLFFLRLSMVRRRQSKGRDRSLINLSVLELLDCFGILHTEEMSALLGYSVSSEISVLLRRLEERGLIDRKREGHKKFMSLTPLGRETLYRDRCLCTFSASHAMVNKMSADELDLVSRCFELLNQRQGEVLKGSSCGIAMYG